MSLREIFPTKTIILNCKEIEMAILDNKNKATICEIFTMNNRNYIISRVDLENKKVYAKEIISEG